MNKELMEKFEKRVRNLGYDLERVVYQLNIQDVVNSIYDGYDDTELFELSDNQLKKLIENGIEAIINIDVIDPIHKAIDR